MRTRRRRSSLEAVLAALALAGLLAAGGAHGAAEEPAAAEGWQGLLGSRPLPELGGRWIVVLRAPSLAERVRRAGGRASELQMRLWTAAARDAQERAVSRLAFRGVPVQPEHSYVRVLNGFAASLDPRLLPALERDPAVEGVFPVRAAYPAALPGNGSILETDVFAPGSGRRPEVGLPGVDGSGVAVALLDTGVDVRHPFLQGRLLTGLDIVDPGSDASAEQNPTQPGRPERHATELAGLLAGVRGPAGIRGVAPGASIMPIRVAGWQPDADGGVSVYGRTDQVLAGLEAAVDPNGDGDAHDAVRIALVGVVEPFASFPDSPLARAVDGALALDTLVVAPAGNDGPAGPGYGSIAAPGGAPGALGVAAADSRRRSPTVHVLLRAGLRVLASGQTPLGGAVPPPGVVTARVAALPRRQVVAVTEGNALDPLFDDAGYSRVAGTAALLPTGPTTPEIVRELAAAGVRAVLVDGPIPAGSLGVDEPVDVPIVGIPAATAADVRATLAAGVPVELAVGAPDFAANPELRAVAPFSSTGLALDGGARPQVAAPGVGLVTSIPGRGEGGAARYGTISGSSAAAAVVAGAAALLADARPDLDAGALRGALVATARRGAGGRGVGLIDLEAASAVELVADPPVAALGALVTPGTPARGSVRLRNVSRRPLAVRLRRGAGTTGVTVTLSRERVVLQPGASAAIEITAEAAVRPVAPGALTGAFRASVVRGPRLRVPWSVAVPVTRRPVISRVRLSSRSFAPSDARPAVVAFVAGRVDGSRERAQLLPLELLDIELYRGARRIGRLARLRDVVPGRYSFGLTGRGPAGARLARGPYVLRIVGAPVGGGPPTSVDVSFRLR
jgi:subtilisin family serine protease